MESRFDIKKLNRQDFRQIYPCPVRFRDTDAIGHVNNAVYLTYFENARALYWQRMTGIGKIEDIPFILAHTEIDYVRPAFFGENLEVGKRLVAIGNKSFTFAYFVANPYEIKAVGQAVLVHYDYKINHSTPIPDALRNKLREFDPPMKGG